MMEVKGFEKPGCIEGRKPLCRIDSSRVRSGYMDSEALEEMPVVQEENFIGLV
jgi:hypothetical protein